MIVLSPEAAAEYEQIYRHYEIMGLRRALHFERQFVRTWNLIDAWPQMYPAVVEYPEYRRALLSRFSYFVYYREVSPAVREIVAIVHTSRRPGYWMEGRVMEETAVYVTAGSR
ncbi:MAG: type II toxin-antitoxin system RelE/ParE family toxin [Gammaproteobacteria bacterium]|nr:type II toxin-antitoxin system RelE/ParE family toxin [Gammaproteobacteria bacterium]